MKDNEINNKAICVEKLILYERAWYREKTITGERAKRKETTIPIEHAKGFEKSKFRERAR